MNSNPLGPPEYLYRQLSDDKSLPIEYPDYKNIDLNLAIAALLNLPAENVAVANGSLEAIFAMSRIVDSSNCSIVKPTYWGYAAALDSIPITHESYILREENGFEFELETLDQLASRSTLLFICNPNNPTATYIEKKDLLPLVKKHKRCHFFIDEAHLFLKSIYEQETLSQEVTRLDNLTIIYSTSKLYNIGGMRTGIVISCKDIIEKFKKYQVPYSTNNISQKIFTELLKDTKFVDRTRIELRKLTAGLYESLKGFPWLKVMPTKTHFILSKIITPSVTAIQLSERLSSDGFGIRECTTSYRELEGEWIRITSNTDEHNQALVLTLKSYQIT